MTDSLFFLIMIGFLIGTMGTLVGAGGGFLLVPLLLFTHPNMLPEEVTAVSMAVVAANAVSGTVAYAFAKRIDYRAGLLFGACTVPGSIIGVYLVDYISLHIFKVVFGMVLILLAVYLFRKQIIRGEKKSPPSLVVGFNQKILMDKNGATYQYAYHTKLGILISVLVGFISPILGIGGGIIHVPAMTEWLQFPVYVATATSHFILAIMSMVSVCIHFMEGSYDDPVTQKMLLGLCLGVIPGAQLGAFISHKINTKSIIKILAICLLLVGIRIIF
ncbi:MAG TPA: sulfite exporter TauE/SafE family protein [Niabella sp.]|nr:sulfite exporter TauE/SafE family protein [Niabella sp.]HRB63670.1 sulfite exporter TauE/SafE family protein [Niabella sp.]HRB74409.1 sulfite exporter TauE/SafE family protein [Niabella sp.]HRC01920.1 sulfite exporter TauE/SafE family protein [Niabella sp.]